MKAGINLSDAVTTVSPTYAAEMQRPATGTRWWRIRSRRDRRRHPEWIDHDEWNPLRSALALFDADSLDGKAAPSALLETFGFTITAICRAPRIGWCRMVDQKGLI
jgi:starch synthase